MKMPIPALDNLEWCNFAICWPNNQSWRAILLGLITTPARGRFWDEETGRVTDAQDIGQEILEKNLPLEMSLMACTDDVALGLQAIAEAMERQADVDAACCASDPGSSGGSGGSGNADGPPTTTTEGGEPDPPPIGFDTWDDYFAYKCSIATQIWQDTHDDVAKINTFNLAIMVTLSAVAVFAPLLAGVFATPIPFDDIAALATLALIVYGIVTTAIGDLQEAIVDAREDMICAIMGAKSVAAARLAWLTAWNEAIDLIAPNNAVSNILQGIASKFPSNDSFNRIFDYDPSRNYPSADCSFCSFSCEFEVFSGTGSPILDSNFIMLSEQDPNGWWYIHFEWVCGDGLCRNLQYDTISIANAGTLGGGQVASCPGGGNLWSYNDGWDALRATSGNAYHVMICSSEQAQLTARMVEL